MFFVYSTYSYYSDFKDIDFLTLDNKKVIWFFRDWFPNKKNKTNLHIIYTKM